MKRDVVISDSVPVTYGDQFREALQAVALLVEEADRRNDSRPDEDRLGDTTALSNARALLKRQAEWLAV